jgi:hypothetical protein
MQLVKQASQNSGAQRRVAGKDGRLRVAEGENALTGFEEASKSMLAAKDTPAL